MLTTSSRNHTRRERFWGLCTGATHSRPQSRQHLRRTRNLATRKFDPVLWIKPFEFPAETAWKQVFDFHAENTGDDEQFQVGNAALLVLKDRHRFSAGVPAEQLEFDGQIILRPALALAELSHLGADDVQLCGPFFNACTLATESSSSCRRYITSCKNVTGILLEQE